MQEDGSDCSARTNSTAASNYNFFFSSGGQEIMSEKK
jgi:hypothetical protein